MAIKDSLKQDSSSMVSKRKRRSAWKVKNL